MKVLMILWQLPQMVLAWLFWAFFCLKDGAAAYGVWVVSDGGRMARVCVVNLGRRGAFTLGDWIFFDRKWYTDGGVKIPTMDGIRHELGHVRQSAALGWLYLIVIALPSVVCTAVAPNLVRGFYMERWADRLSEGLSFEIVND